MRRTAAVALLLVLAATPALTWPALAQPAPDAENGRFTFSPVPDGLMRLDTRTGQVSLCARRSAGWACQALPDDRTAYENEIGRLQNENVALKKVLIARGIPLPSGVTQPTADKPGPSLKLPSDEDVDRVVGFLEKVWKRLINMVQSSDKKG